MFNSFRERGDFQQSLERDLISILSAFMIEYEFNVCQNQIWEFLELLVGSASWVGNSPISTRRWECSALVQPVCFVIEVVECSIFLWLRHFVVLRGRDAQKNKRKWIVRFFKGSGFQGLITYWRLTGTGRFEDRQELSDLSVLKLTVSRVRFMRLFSGGSLCYIFVPHITTGVQTRTP